MSTTTYTLTFDANGGTGYIDPMIIVSTSSEETESNSTIGISNNTDIIDEHRFSLDKTGTPKICTGIWYGDVAACKELADEYEIPCVLVATSTGCEYCSTFDSDVLVKPTFKQWMVDSGYLFCMVKVSMGNWTGTNGVGMQKWLGGLGSLPCVAWYWKKDGEVVVDATKTVIVGRGKIAQWYMDTSDNYFNNYSFFSNSYATGSWITDYRAAYNYANSKNIPVVALVTKYDSGCSFCAEFRKKYESSEFTTWMATSGYIFSMFKSTAPYDNDKNWVDLVRGSYTEYPLVFLHWTKSDGTEVNVRFVGRVSYIGDVDSDGTKGTVADLIKKIENTFSGYSSTQDGDIRNHVTYTTDMAIYPRGWIYFTGDNSQDASTLLTNLANSGYKALVFQHAAGCTLCSAFISSVLYDSEVISTLASSNLVLIDFFSGSGWFSTANQRALQGTTGAGYPNAAILNGNQTMTDAYNNGNRIVLQNASKSTFLNWLSNYL